jgi:hypothetical protein
VTAPEANAGKTKSMFMSREQNAGQNQNINIGKKKKSLKVSVLETVKKQNCLHDDIKNGLN